MPATLGHFASTLFSLWCDLNTNEQVPLEHEPSTKMAPAGLALLILLYILLCLGMTPEFLSSYLRGFYNAFDDQTNQTIAFFCVLLYYGLFLSLRFYKSKLPLRTILGEAPFVLFVFAICLRLGIYHRVNSELLVLLTGAALGQWVALIVDNMRTNTKEWLSRNILLFWVTLFTLLAVWNAQSAGYFEYHSSPRLSGLFENPNIFGLLMGVGFVLAVGQLFENYQTNSQSENTESGAARSNRFNIWESLVPIILLIESMVIARALLFSYSRGAWFGCFIGVMYLFYFVNLRVVAAHRFIYRNFGSISIIVTSTFVLVHLIQPFPKSTVMARIFSITNSNDFSWQNRIAAWKASLQIIGDHPWFGIGWDQIELLYHHYYITPRVGEAGAVDLNDYFSIGTADGIPALLCFIVFCWFKIVNVNKMEDSETLGKENAIQFSNLYCREKLRYTCRAAAIVLLVGFWFDGGLFKLPTAATFWILLELGSSTRAAKLLTNGTHGF